MPANESEIITHLDMEKAVFPQYHQLANVVICWKDSVLLLHRLTDPFKNFWSIPGGGVELHEKYVEAARREIMEEAGIHLSVAELKPMYIFVDHVHKLEGHIYRCDSLKGEYANQEIEEHDVLTWKRFEEAIALRLTPGVKDALVHVSQLR